MTCVAIINDDSAFLSLLQDALKLEGWDTYGLPENEAAVEAVKKLQPDLILLDLRLPDSDGGWALIDGLTADPEIQEIPIVVFSAVPDELKDREEWLTEHGI